ncbi:hypothetical protein [Hydrogenophaga laconesensis]|uniref:PsiF repeat-containing protein n=1 Tax=Hydrogenophaga laconesensis TaxID=1805971 RepID=A0ABU1VH45_9BURK|nr:hypothetical protein [Hydrogenophaga laconesensis]MDR7096807.1 hypothetical protein [Hydrogenophaga laconesensis]
MSGYFSRALAVTVLGALATTALHATEPSTRKLPSRVTFHKAPSEEAPAVREKRLKRECKGRPNAGMCAGYTR